MTKLKNDKIREALELINEAAREKKDALYELFSEKYSEILDLIVERMETGKEIVNRAQKQIHRAVEDEEEKILKAAKRIDRKVHHHPWPVLGAVAVGSFVLGVYLKQRSASKESEVENP